MVTLKNVLVATDFGSASETALAYGRDLARAFGARLHVLHVTDDVLAKAIGGDAYAVDFAELQRSVEESARRRLEAVVTDADRQEFSATAALRTSTSAAVAIIEYAKEADIDLIVMGTHGRGGMAHLFMGSVAERVVRTAPCPVLTVRQPEPESVAPEARQATAHS